MPENYDVTADPLMAEFGTIATETKLSTEQAQKFVDLYTKAATQLAAENKSAWEKTNEAWVNEIKADPEIGGEKLQTKVLPAISSLINEIGGAQSAEVRKALDLTGAGNNPAIIRFLAKAAEALGEARGHPQGQAASKSAGIGPQALYPNRPL